MQHAPPPCAITGLALIRLERLAAQRLWEVPRVVVTMLFLSEAIGYAVQPEGLLVGALWVAVRDVGFLQPP